MSGPWAIILGGLLGWGPVFAVRAGPVRGWVTTNGDAGFAEGSEATASPITTSADADTIAANLDAPIRLEDGAFLMLTGAVTFDIPLKWDDFRIGLFQGDDPVRPGDGNGFVGFYAGAGVASRGGNVKFGNGTAANPFSASAATVLGRLSPPRWTPPANTRIEFYLKITRTGDTLEVAAGFSDGDLYQTTADFSGWVPPADYDYTFNCAAFLMGGNLNGARAVYEEIDVSVGSVDSDQDGMNDDWERAHGLVVGIDDSALDEDADGGPDGLTNLEEFQRGTDPQDADTDDDALRDGVETNTGIFVDASDTGTSPILADTDGDGLADGVEVANGTDPNDPDDPGSILGERLFGIDFNRNDQLGSPSQSLFRVIAGSADSAANQPAYEKKIGEWQVTVSRPDGQNFEFRGANGDSSRAIPGGDTSRSFLVADFIGTRGGVIVITITGLTAGDYVFRSFHLEPFTLSALGFAQGTDPTTPNTIEARFGDEVVARVQPTALGAAGLGTTFISDDQIPTLLLPFHYAGTEPLAIELHALKSHDDQRFLFLNGFELFRANPQ